MGHTAFEPCLKGNEDEDECDGEVMKLVQEKDLPLLRQTVKRLIGSARRRQVDYYPTPPAAIEAFLDREEFQGRTLEPACGDGRLWLACRKRGIDCSASDLLAGTDFLQTKKRWDNIVTNPPYKLANEFVRHALELADHKVAMLLQIEFLAGVNRQATIWRHHKLKSLYVFSRRLQFEGCKASALGSHAWFVWERGWKGKTKIEHIVLS